MNLKYFDTMNQALTECNSKLLKLNETIEHTNEAIRLWNAEQMSDICDEIDDITNKPLYGSDKKRDSELLIRQSNAGDYAAMASTLKLAKAEQAKHLNKAEELRNRIQFVIAAQTDANRILDAVLTPKVIIVPVQEYELSLKQPEMEAMIQAAQDAERMEVEGETQEADPTVELTKSMLRLTGVSSEFAEALIQNPGTYYNLKCSECGVEHLCVYRELREDLKEAVATGWRLEKDRPFLCNNCHKNASATPIGSDSEAVQNLDAELSKVDKLEFLSKNMCVVCPHCKIGYESEGQFDIKDLDCLKLKTEADGTRYLAYYQLCDTCLQGSTEETGDEETPFTEATVEPSSD